MDMKNVVVSLAALALLVGCVGADWLPVTHLPNGGEFVGVGQISCTNYVWSNGWGSTIVGNATYTAPMNFGDQGTWMYSYNNGTVASGYLPSSN
jgi:hypothetical protein